MRQRRPGNDDACCCCCTRRSRARHLVLCGVKGGRRGGWGMVRACGDQEVGIVVCVAVDGRDKEGEIEGSGGFSI